MQRRLTLLSTVIFISIFLAFAAYGKFFYPSEHMQQIDRWTSYFEIGFIVLLFIFHLESVMWLIAAPLFASWGGYATYWLCLKMPCGCLGTLIPLPSVFALSLDVLFLVVSCSAALLLGAARSLVYLSVLIGCLSALIGYAFADFVLIKLLLGMIWNFF
jgi:hypothetical protein